MSAEHEAAFAERLVGFRRHLHANPELSHEEHETTASIRKWLEEARIRVLEQYQLKTGVIAEIGDARGGPVIALRADIDALPIQEQTGLPFASRHPGKMHACGHDYHTAALLGAAILLKERESELPGTVRLLFQPAEEKAKGASQVIASGALEGVRAVFGLHNKPDLPVGTVGVRPGPIMASADGFLVEVSGVSSHAAVPEASIDPIVAAAHIITALQTIVSRSVGALDSAVVSVTRLNAGTAWNVIAEQAVFDGTLRTFSERTRETVRGKFERIVTGVAASLGAEAKVHWIDGPPAVVNDPAWAELSASAAASLGLKVVEPQPSPAGEDFAFYLREAPGNFLFVGTSGPQEWHHPAFDIDERALPITAKLLASIGREALVQLVAQGAASRKEAADVNAL